MISYDSHHKAIQKRIRVRKAIFERAVIRLKDLIDRRRGAAPNTPIGRLLADNKINLKHALEVIAAYEAADKALADCCCQNDLNCEIDVI